MTLSSRLSERNCIEVVSLLIEKGLLDVIFTNDGKEYLTPDQLTHEINEELFVAGGRINLTELAKILNVDLSRITASATKISHKSKKIFLILGQLIHDDYIQRVAAEINEKLHLAGELSVTQLTEQYDLPADFIQQKIIDKNLGSIIIGKRDSSDSKVLFTLSFISRCKAKVRGALTGITRPVSVASICAQCKLKEKLFHTLFDELKIDGTVTSRMTGAQYIPGVYKKMQNEFVSTRFRQNGYVQHDAVAQFGVGDAKGFIRRHLPNEDLIELVKCTIGRQLLSQLEGAFEECLATGSYLDVLTVMPSDLAEEDIDKLMELIITPAHQKNTLVLGTTILTNVYVDTLLKPFDEVLQAKCKEAVASGKYQQFIVERQAASNRSHDLDRGGDDKSDRREERRKKAASGKAGGGAQGRETKTKSTKKHYRGGDKGGGAADSDSNDEQQQQVTKKTSKQAQLDLITTRDIVTVINAPLEAEGLEDLAKQIAAHYYPALSKQAMATAQTLFEATQTNNLQSRRQTHAQLQEKLNNLYNDVRLYEKGLKLLPVDVQQQLTKYLLKSLGQDICNEMCLYVAQECSLSYTQTELTADQRMKIVQEAEVGYKQPLLAVIKTLSGASLEDFFSATEETLTACSMILKKVDKKKDRTLILCHKHGLLDQLANCTDPALVLHLAALVVFTVATQSMLHASGRHVSAVLAFLQTYLQTEESQLLTQYHDLVLKVLTVSKGEEEGESETTTTVNDEAQAVLQQLAELTPRVKEIAVGFKRNANATE